jgi:signal transduction histidine kinase
MRLVSGDLNSALLESIDSQRPVAENKKLLLTSSLESGIPAVVFDKDRLAQVMANLLSNALKFTEKGNIVVKSVARYERNCVEISVEDTGPGIKAEDISRLFEKFQQLESNAYNKSGGTGLGLAISKMIVEKHGGKIWAESEYGKGTKVIFVLPIMERRKG